MNACDCFVALAGYCVAIWVWYSSIAPVIVDWMMEDEESGHAAR